MAALDVKKCLNIASIWLSRLNKAIAASDAEAFASCIDSDGWFRDLMTFTWDFRARQGYAAIKSYLLENDALARAGLSKIQLEDTHFGKPSLAEFGHGQHLVVAALRFETRNAHGRGFVRISCNASEAQEDVANSEPTAFALMMMVNNWKGHEETSYESGIYDGHNLSWEEVRQQRREAVEHNPDVIIRA